MEKYFDKYKSSLKNPEAEEIIDLLFFRPVAFILVKTIYQLPITPNQVSFLSAVFGLASAGFFIFGETIYYRIGALLLLGANLLDCVDGQLARIQGSGTFLGRIIDGVADYITGFAVFIALGIGFKSDLIWILAVGAGISSMLHAIAFDYYQSEFLKVRAAQSNITADDVKKYFKNNIKELSNIEIVVSRIYLFYLPIQASVMKLFSVPNYQLDEYQVNDSRLIRLWSFLGPSTNRSMLMIFCFIGLPLFYLFVVLIGGNIWFMICLLRQSLVSNYSGNPKQ
jgi:phosphatidylglycerophosphate synthase